jgi:LysR family transcriptional activator of glutamate synthase operon
LEKELGIQLFDRSNRQIKLTEDGQLILEDVKRIVTDYQILEANLTKHREKKASDSCKFK